MHPEQIKAAIRMTGTTPAVLAEELNLSRSTVSQVINGRCISARVMAHISQVTGIPVDTLWSSEPHVTKLRRPSLAPAQKLAASERRDQARRERERREQSRRDGERRVGAAA